MPAKRLTALVVAFALAGCSQVFKPRVTATETVDANGQHTTTYKNCDPTRVLDGEALCYTESQTDTYCYRSLGDVNCFTRPPADKPVSITDATPE